MQYSCFVILLDSFALRLVAPHICKSLGTANKQVNALQGSTPSPPPSFRSLQEISKPGGVRNERYRLQVLSRHRGETVARPAEEEAGTGGSLGSARCER
jgi:hypothetical protein